MRDIKFRAWDSKKKEWLPFPGVIEFVDFDSDKGRELLLEMIGTEVM